MDKIILAINSMIINSNRITDILLRGNEYFFKYNNKIWGILKRKDGIIALSYYSDANEVSDIGHYLCSLDNCKTYFSDSYKALESLYLLISGKREEKIIFNKNNEAEVKLCDEG